MDPQRHPHTEAVVKSSLQSVRTPNAQLNDLSALSTPPKSSSFEALRNLASRFGLKSAFLSAALGVGVGPEQLSPQAKGEIISFYNTFQNASQQAERFTYVGGGNLVPIFASATRIATNEVVTARGSASLLNGSAGMSAAHVISGLTTPEFKDLKLEIALTNNCKERSALNSIAISSFTVSPRYGGSAGAGEDLFTFRLAEHVANVPEITFWSEVYPNSPLLGAGTQLTTVGFGRAGSLAGSDWSPEFDGPAYAGETFVNSIQVGPDGYVNTAMDIFSANGANASSGSSGSRLLVFDSLSNRYLDYAMPARSGSSPFSSTSTHLLFGSEEVSFIRGTTTAVPEPSALILSALGLGSLITRSWLRPKKSQPNA